jgi:hypothetical protein
MTVYVLFWFDVEDYITPASDVALGRVIDIFDRHGLKATFKLVGEKVRVLQRRGHRDILARLQAHDIGYHTDYHSRPPSIAEYLLDYDWADGITAFRQREQAGLETLTQAFDRPPCCYGQPGGAWAPQVYPVLRQWGIPVYLDAGPWVNLDHQPHRYGDILNILNVEGLMHLGISRGPQEVSRRQTALVSLVDRLRPTGGVISLYAHECEFVTRAFWDGVNFKRGQDTPREHWRPAPVLSDAESAARYAALDDFLGVVRALPDAEVIGASQLPALYPDKIREHGLTLPTVLALCPSLVDTITHQEVAEGFISPAELFGLVVDVLAQHARTGQWPTHVPGDGGPVRYLDGPSHPLSQSDTSGVLTLDDVLDMSVKLQAHLVQRQQMPAHVQVGPLRLTPADFLATIASALPRWVQGDSGDVPVRSGNFVQANHVPNHVAWDWIIFPLGFNGDPLLELGKLQAWTLKPVGRPQGIAPTLRR